MNHEDGQGDVTGPDNTNREHSLQRPERVDDLAYDHWYALRQLEDDGNPLH